MRTNEKNDIISPSSASPRSAALICKNYFVIFDEIIYAVAFVDMIGLKHKTYGGEYGMETAYQKVKVHNELEWCQVSDLDTKEKIEKALLKHRVSYFVKWEKPKFFSGDKFGTCIFCVNQLQKEIADDAVQDLKEEVKERLRFVNRKVDRTFY